MILKWSKHTGSDGSGRQAVAYLVAPEWKKEVAGVKVLERRMPPPEVLHGDPELVARAIESAPGRLKYSSCVASFHKADIDIQAFNNGDPAARQAVNDYIDGWMDAAYAGLPRSARPPVLVSTHTHASRLELNFLAPRAVLVGDKLKAYNPAPPGPARQRLFNALDDFYNSKNCWADPRDPARERLVKVPDHILKDARAAGRLNLRSTSRKDVREVIADQIARRIDRVEITDRSSIVAHLRAAGFQIVRETKKSITIADPADPADHKKRLRLEGPFFTADFDARRYLDERRRATPQGGTAREIDRMLFRSTAEQRLIKELAFRAQTNAALAAQIAAAVPPVDPIDLDADRIFFNRLPEPEPYNPLESDDDRDRSRSGLYGRARHAEPPRPNIPAAARARPAPGRGRPTGPSAGNPGAGAERPGHAPGRLGALRLPDAILARSRRAGAVFESKDNLCQLSRRHLDRGSRISAMPLHADAHDFLEQRGPPALAEMRRRSQRDRRLASQSARLTREGWSIEKRAEWKQQYLDRLYSGPPLNSDLLLDIRFIDTRAKEIQFWDGCRVRDEGDRIVADWASQSSIELMVAQAQAAGWEPVRFTGRARDVAALVAEAHRQGLSVDGHPGLEPAPTPTATQGPERPDDEEFHMPKPTPSSPKPSRQQRPKFLPDPPGYLKRLKEEVDLVAVAEKHGFVFDEEKSTKDWPCWRFPATGREPRRILIGKNKSDEWVWQDRETKRGGDVFNFLGEQLNLDPRIGLEFNQLKREAAKFIGATPPSNDSPPSRSPRPASADDEPRDFSQIRATWAEARRDPAPRYLTDDRQIPHEILADPRFVGSFRIVSNNVAFPYHDAAGAMVGFERRWTPSRPGQAKANYVEGGAVGIWQSNESPLDTELVVCEGPIDCMAYHGLLQKAERSAVRYATIRKGGEPVAALRKAIAALPAGGKVVGAVDNDSAGDDYLQTIRELARELGREFVERRAVHAKDWNDELRYQAELRAREATAAPTQAERAVEPAAAAPIVEPVPPIVEQIEDDYPSPGM